jgi:hypothetical protein
LEKVHGSLSLSVLRKKGYRFGQSIVTDGVSVSIPLCAKKQERGKKRKSPEEEGTTDQTDEHVDYSHLEGRTIVGVDPGKYSIIYMTSDDKLKKQGKTRMQISNVERRRALGTRMFAFIRQKKKNQPCNHFVKDGEALLSSGSSKATSVKGFQEYVRSRLDVQEQLYRYYGALMFRIHRWERYKRQERFHHNIIKQIRDKFGPDCVLAYGSWNRNTQMRGLIPSPTCGFRRLLAKKFTVVDTPEPNTTKTCSV